jgi:hypothetical protein
MNLILIEDEYGIWYKNVVTGIGFLVAMKRPNGAVSVVDEKISSVSSPPKLRIIK